MWDNNSALDLRGNKRTKHTICGAKRIEQMRLNNPIKTKCLNLITRNDITIEIFIVVQCNAYGLRASEVKHPSMKEKGKEKEEDSNKSNRQVT